MLTTSEHLVDLDDVGMLGVLQLLIHTLFVLLSIQVIVGDPLDSPVLFALISKVGDEPKASEANFLDKFILEWAQGLYYLGNH